MRMSAGGAIKTQLGRRRFPSFGKAWTSGDKLRVLYPCFYDEENEKWGLLINAVYGHSIDIEQLSIQKRFFIPSNAVIVDDEVVTPDALLQYSRIAPLILAGEKEQALRKNVAKAKGDATLQRTLDQKTEELFKDKKVAVGRLDYSMTTECLAIPLDSTGAPNPEKIAMVTQNLSQKKAATIEAIINDPQFTPKDKDATWIEVSYTFGNTGNKNQDGQVDAKGVSESVALHFTHPQFWNEKVMPLIGYLPLDSDMIRKRNSNYKPVAEEVIIAAIKTHAMMNSDLLEGIDSADHLDAAKRSAQYLISLDLSFAPETKIYSMLEEAKENLKVEATAPKTGDAPSIMDLVSKEDIKHAQESAGEKDIFPEEEEEEETAVEAPGVIDTPASAFGDAG